MKKTLRVNRGVYITFMGLEKAHDRIDGNTLWQILKIYCMKGNIFFLV